MYVASLSLCVMTALPEGEGMIQTSTSLNERGHPSGRISWLKRPCGHLGRIGVKRCFHWRFPTKQRRFSEPFMLIAYFSIRFRKVVLFAKNSILDMSLALFPGVSITSQKPNPW
jgi:hypothetical protein